MITIKKDGYVFSVDIEKTKKYYETHSLCTCADCRNYYAQIKSKYPKLDAFLTSREHSVYHISRCLPDLYYSLFTIH